MPGSGKTTVGKKLAQKLQYSFLDTDKLIERELGTTINELFQTKGELFFRQMEKQLLLHYPFPEKTVISTGGGMPCEQENLSILKKSGLIIYLKQTPQILCHRIMHSQQTRPAMHGKNKEQQLKYLMETLHKRQPFYEQADYIITSSKDCIKTLAQILQNNGKTENNEPFFLPSSKKKIKTSNETIKNR